jgi:hypothetical protein
LVIIVKPLHKVAIIPQTSFCDLLYACELAYAVLLAFSPATVVLFTIGPDVNSLAMLLIVKEMTFVNSAIFVKELSVSVHFILSPFTFEFPTV